MAEGVVLAAAWFTVRMICQVSYKAVKSFRQGKPTISSAQAQGDPDARREEDLEAKGDLGAKGAYVHAGPAYGGDDRGDGGRHYVQAVPAKAGASDEGCVPWAPAAGKAAETSSQAQESLRADDSLWLEELRRATNSRSRDDLRLLGEIQGVGNKIDNLSLEALHEKLRNAMKLLLEYQQNPTFRTANERLKLAEEEAIRVCNNERSLVMSLRALRLRIIITYLHYPKHSKGLEPSMDDKEGDKRQCYMIITNTLTQGPLDSLCREFLAARDSRNKQERERVELETSLAFDLILEVISSVYVLEPFKPSKGPLPEGVPDIVLHALSAYCKSGLGDSHIYTDLTRALNDWESSPQRKERWALHCLYNFTEGPAWTCSEGWDRVFEAELSSLYGVSTKGGRVTKISLGANNLEGLLPPQLGDLGGLQELSLPGNKLRGKIPAALWDLPSLRVVAVHGNSLLHGNSFTVAPPESFRPAACGGASAEGSFQAAARRRHGIAGKVETRNPGRLEVYKGEWFSCSWKVTNIGGVAFAKGTKLSRGDEHSKLGGAEDVGVNPLEPGEEQIVSAMQQAPDYEAWGVRDDWALVGDGLDFVDDDEAKSQTPIIRVLPRPASSGKKRVGGADARTTLADTAFVADIRHRRGSSPHSFGSSFHHPGT